MNCVGMSHSGPSSSYLTKINFQISLPEEMTLETRKQKKHQKWWEKQAQSCKYAQE